MKKIKNIWFVSREYDGLAGAGGVKDVCRQLAEALSRVAHVSIMLPCYGFMDPKLLGFNACLSLTVHMNYATGERQEEVMVWRRKVRFAHGGQLTIHLADAARFQEKLGVYAYTDQEELLDPLHLSGQGHVDYFAMNVLLQKAALAFMIQSNDRPDIVHCHDGHTALIPALARHIDGFRHFFVNTGFVVTIHNAGTGYHQEVADLPFAQAITGLPQGFIRKNLLAGHFDPFIAAAGSAILNTVSENYAHELRATDADELTGGLGHFLMGRGVKLRGITNGIDPDSFDTRDHRTMKIAAPFSVAEGGLGRQKKCRIHLYEILAEKDLLVQRFGSLQVDPTLPLLTFIGRFSAQKGVDVLVKALESLLATEDDFQVIVLGSGQADISLGLKDLATDPDYAGRLCLLEGYDQELAGQIYAAGDFFIIPSQYEPCGLTDFIAQLNGNLPIVHHVGGLVKVVDGETGFAYKSHTALSLRLAIRRALAVFRGNQPKILAMQQQAVQVIEQSYTWEKVMHRYLDLYRKALCKE